MQDSSLTSCVIVTGKCSVLLCDIQHSPGEPCYGMRLPLDRDALSDWLEEKFVFWAWTGFGPSWVWNLPCGMPAPQHAGGRGAGSRREASRGTGRRSEPVPFLAEKIKGQIWLRDSVCFRPSTPGLNRNWIGKHRALRQAAHS